MEKLSKYLLIVCIILIVIKSSLALSIPNPSAFSDEYVFARMARSFYYQHNLNMDGIPSNVHPPLYPIVISQAYLAGNMELVYAFMKLTNVILTTLAIIPIFLILRRFLSEKKSLLASIVISLSPPLFSFPSYIMAENLFYFLFILLVFFIYNLLETRKKAYIVLSGITLGLCFLTKFMGIALFSIPLILIIIKLVKKDFSQEKPLRFVLTQLLVIFIALVIIAPWIIRTGNLFGYSISSLMGAYSYEAVAAIKYSAYPIAFLNWFLLYLAYIILGSGVVLGIIAFSHSNQNPKAKYLYTIFFMSLFLFLILAANHASGILRIKTPFPWFTERPIGRYIESLIPFIMTLGFISMESLDKQRLKKALFCSIPLFVIASQLAIANLFLVNNLSLSHIGALKYILDFLVYSKTSFEPAFFWGSFIILLIIFSLIPLAIASLITKISFSSVLKFLAILFIALAIINFSTIYYYSSNYWGNNEQTQLGKFIAGQNLEPSTILYDQDYEGKLGWQNQGSLYERFLHDNTFATAMGFWLNHDLVIGDVNNPGDADYIITKKELPYKKLKATSHNIKLYQVSQA